MVMGTSVAGRLDDTAGVLVPLLRAGGDGGAWVSGGGGDFAVGSGAEGVAAGGAASTTGGGLGAASTTCGRLGAASTTSGGLGSSVVVGCGGITSGTGGDVALDDDAAAWTDESSPPLP